MAAGVRVCQRLPVRGEKPLEKGRSVMAKDLLTTLAAGMPQFSKGQKLIARYLISHYDKAAFMTASRLGATVGVSESTVVRFATEVGFDGYPQLQRNLQELIRNRLTSAQRMEVTSDQIGSNDVLTRVLSLDMEKIRRTLEETSKEDFESAVNALLEAKNIYVVGVRSSAPLANFIGFYFNHIFSNCHLVSTTSASDMFEQLMRIGEGDVLVAISFPRYSHSTVKAAQFARDNGATLVAITDSRLSPLAQTATHLLLARTDMASFVDSLVAPMSVANALIVAVGLRKREEISVTYQKLERIWDEYHVYEKAEETGNR